MKNILLMISCCVSASILVSGCSILDTVSGDKKDQYVERAEEVRDQAYKYIPRERKYSNIYFDEGFFVPKTIASENYDDWFYKPVKYTFDSVSLKELMNIFSYETGVVSRAVKDSSETVLDMEKKFPLYFEGRMGDALESVSLATGYGFAIEGKLISWSQFTTASFLMTVPPSIQSFRIGDKDKELSSSDTSGASGASTIETLGSSDSFSNIEVIDLNTWTELMKSLEMLKSEKGGISFDKSSSLLLVKDYPRNVRAIRNHINKVKEVSMTQVVFDFQFLEYSNTEGGTASLNLNLINSALEVNAKDITATLTNAFEETLLTDTVAASLGFVNSTGTWAGSQVIIEALQKQGVVSVLSRPTVLASHNKNAFVDLGSSVAFASSSSVNQNQTSTASGLTTTFLDLGTRINVVPTIMDNKDELFIQLGIDMSSLDRIREFESNGTRVQQPDTQKRKMVLNFSAQSGETILITGNQSNRNQYQSADSGWLSMLLGGSRSSSEEYTEMLILITPRIVRPTK